MSTFQRILRGPFLWILIVILAASWVIQLTGQLTGYKDVPTSQVIQVNLFVLNSFGLYF